MHIHIYIIYNTICSITHPRELEEAAAHPLLACQHKRGPVDDEGAGLALLVPVLLPVVLFVDIVYIFLYLVRGAGGWFGVWWVC